MRDPLSYRGITLASTMYKIFCGVLNHRLSVWSETNGLIVDEQNGFRKRRACIDHLGTLTSIAETRLKRKQSTFVSFIDFSKAYDRIDRRLLWVKLEQLGLQGKMLCSLKGIYRQVQCCVRLNGVDSEWFDVACGLKQGCLLSPLLFNIYVNDLADEMKRGGFGVDIDGENVPILLYVDDIALLSESEDVKLA